MKKFSGIVLSFLLLIVFFVSGCTYADKATLVSINDKYQFICSKNQDNLFVGDDFNPVYKSGSLSSAINDNIGAFGYLKSTSDRENVVMDNIYGLLYRAVNSTYFSTDALKITYDKMTEKKYKKSMYIALEDLQKNIETLKTNKKSLESVFNNSEKTYLEVAKEQTAIYDLNNYLNSLNICLKNLLEFNKNYYYAIVNNIFPSTEICTLLNKPTSEIEFTYSNFNQLINNCNILISNYILIYSSDLLQNIAENSELSVSLRELLTLQVNPKIIDGDAEKIENFKIIKALEDSLNKEEVVFISSCEALNSDTVKSNDEKYSLYQNQISNYTNNLLNYSKSLIKFLKSL